MTVQSKLYNFNLLGQKIIFMKNIARHLERYFCYGFIKETTIYKNRTILRKVAKLLLPSDTMSDFNGQYKFKSYSIVFLFTIENTKRSSMKLSDAVLLWTI